MPAKATAPVSPAGQDDPIIKAAYDQGVQDAVDNPPLQMMANVDQIIGSALDEALASHKAAHEQKISDLTENLTSLIKDSFAEYAPEIRKGSFDPTTLPLINLSGKEYMQVQWRVLWFRTENPRGVIETELIEHDAAKEFALFRSRVTREDGGSATGYGSETRTDFKDYIEKAEMKSIGRALAAAGFGTQFSGDLEDGGAKDRPADSPVDRSGSNQQGEFRASPERPSSPKQHGFIAGLLESKAGLAKGAMAKEQVDLIVAERFAEKGYTQLPQLNQLEASDWINELNNRSGQDQSNQNRPARPPIPEGDKAPVANPAMPAKVDYDSIDPMQTGKSEVPFLQLREEMNLDASVSEQVKQWKANVALENDPELPAEAVREACKVLAWMAHDVRKLIPVSLWRFAEMAKLCIYPEALDGIAKVAELAGGATSFVTQAIAGRRRALAAQAN